MISDEIWFFGWIQNVEFQSWRNCIQYFVRLIFSFWSKKIFSYCQKKDFTALWGNKLPRATDFKISCFTQNFKGPERQFSPEWTWEKILWTEGKKIWALEKNKWTECSFKFYMLFLAQRKSIGKNLPWRIWLL